MFRIAFATYPQLPSFSDDDRPAAEILNQFDIDVRAVSWDRNDVQWERFDCVIIRSAWDYHQRVAQYAQWIQRFRKVSGQLWNPVDTVLGNLNKKYLVQFARKGLHVVPTAFLQAGTDTTLRNELKSRNWNQAVIKPAISANSSGTWRSSLDSAGEDQARFATQLTRQDTLIQPFMQQVAELGEWSLIFFSGEYSHAVLKRPAAQDFRVQRDFGGSIASAHPPAHFISQAKEILANVGGPLLYARVDGIEHDGQFMLMELEINEPYLFLGTSHGAAERFAQAILRVLSSKTIGTQSSVATPAAEVKHG